ncbi:MAG: hypothetical protein NTY93_00725 [Candidatus Kaiserbacteria bacterium]|nr:hypothetical protein [Candidatus Kaiserbacteria bacterium]
MKLLNEGKTKKIWAGEGKDAGGVIVESKDDITAGDGKKHDVIIGKGAIANRTTSNVFRFLKECGIPVAFIRQVAEEAFLAERCDMIPLEVVVRREAHGSFLHRNPHLEPGHLFPKLVLEFFAKTSGKTWDGNSIPIDDPLVDLFGNPVTFYIPHWTDEQKENNKKTGFKGFLVGQRPFLSVQHRDFFLKIPEAHLVKMEQIARRTFLILEKAWQLAGRRLVDFKIEFGINNKGELRLADVIDNDSWRVIYEGKFIDKQLYRDGAELNEVTAKFREVAELTGRFELPKQQIIFWGASKSDDMHTLWDAYDKIYDREICGTKTAFCSLHEEPVHACDAIARLVQEVPDSVVIAPCRRSNGAGPILSAQVTVPVITVPTNWKEFPEDIWSSLRTPSDAPDSFAKAGMV